MPIKSVQQNPGINIDRLMTVGTHTVHSHAAVEQHKLSAGKLLNSAPYPHLRHNFLMGT